MERFYPIGVPGVPWTEVHKMEWLAKQTAQRSYHDEVLAKVEALRGDITVEQYGALPIDPDVYRLMAVTMRSSVEDAPWALITGGVHGYETSGVQGALLFLETAASSYQERVNLVVAPCVSAWGYEVINRWNPSALDPNRSFYPNSPSEEAASLMNFVSGLDVDFLMHIDLHETTDSDEDEFRPAVAARDGVSFEPGVIPDGFYTVGDSDNPEPDFQAAIVAGVERVTHIAPADDSGQIIGAEVTQHGVINYPYVELGLCAGMTYAPFTTTTEVYPDSLNVTADTCNDAQVAAVRAGLDFALSTVAD